MHIYAIGDLHFSGVPEAKPMTVFGEHWQDHRQRITENWKQTVAPEDIVVLCGDISWAMKLPDAVQDDLRYIAGFPGNKVMLRGNRPQGARSSFCRIIFTRWTRKAQNLLSAVPGAG